SSKELHQWSADFPVRSNSRIFHDLRSSKARLYFHISADWKVRAPLTPSLPHRGAVRQPDHVQVIGGRNDQWHIFVLWNRFGAWVSPFMDFRMAIHERDAASAVVIAGWKIDNSNGCVITGLDHLIS